MSKPTTTVAVPVPRRSRVPRLRDLRVRSKLGLILAVPLLAVVGLSAAGLVDAEHRAASADEVRALASLSADASDLVHQLQVERTAAAALLTGYGDLNAYKTSFAATDQAVQRYHDERAALSDPSSDVSARLVPVDTAIRGLDGLRTSVALPRTDANSVPFGSAMFSYNLVVERLLDFRDMVWRKSADATVSDEVRAAAAFSQAKEYAAQEQTAVIGSLYNGQASPAQFRAYQVATAGQQESLKEFYSAAKPQQLAAVEATVGGETTRQVSRLENQLNMAMSTYPLDSIAPGAWIAATNDRITQMRAAEVQLDKTALDSATVVLDNVRRSVVTEASLVVAILLLAVLLALMVARSMVRSLRQLREVAIGVAYEGLPKAVARLRDPEFAGESNPEVVAAQVEDPLPVRGRDEFGQVAQAFNVVHREAVRVAAEQAVLRANVATMFVNLARRSQILVDRLIGHLDRLEKGEEDPDRLASLFQLDHLATRMRRNDENLLVLAGADSTRVQREPAPLGDVLRAAQSEVEHYTRIEFGVVDRDIEVAPHAVNDLVHLVAELFDNATAFSPPDTAVVVDARRLADRAILQVEDRGIGITGEQLAALNERLANPPMVDVAVSRMMGLVVVSRLANRHGIRVELQPARDRGIIAQVLLPAEVLGSGAAATPSREAVPVFAAPLALPEAESAPAVREPARPAARGTTVPTIPPPAANPPPGRDVRPAAFHPGDAPVRPASAPPSVNGHPIGTGGGRPVPSWHDLTGVPMIDFPATSGWGPSTGSPVYGGPARPARPAAEPGPAEPTPGPAAGEEAPAGATAQDPSAADPPADDEVADTSPATPGATTAEDAGAEDGPRTDAAAVEAAPSGTDPTATDANSEARAGTGEPDTPSAAGREESTAQASAEPGAPVRGREPGGDPERAADDAAAAIGDQGRSVPRQRPGPAKRPPEARTSPYAPPAPPGHFSPALPADMTFEMPRVVDAAPAAPATPASSPPATPAPAEPASSAPATRRSPESAEGVAGDVGPGAPPRAAAAESVTPPPAVPPARPAAADPIGGPSELSSPLPHNADDTMELPIFREVESAWFSTGWSAPVSSEAPSPAVDADSTPRAPASAPPASGAGPSVAAAADRLKVAPRQPAPSPEQPEYDRRPSPPAPATPRIVPPTQPRSAPTAPPAAPPLPPQRWQGAADRGWRAAAAAADPPTSGTTSTGLPKRVPMAQLVPGGTGAGAGATDRRSPDAVRGLLSAYHRGVQRGRGQRPTGDQPEGPVSDNPATGDPADPKTSASQPNAGGVPGKEQKA